MLVLDFFFCDTKGFLQVMNFIKILLSIIKFVIPLLLIVMITIDLLKNVFNPDNKEGVNNIKKRLVAAIIVFLIPTIIDLLMVLIEKNVSLNGETDYKITNCYINANNDCIKKIDDYLACTDHNKDDNCLKFRSCNSYKLENNCKIKTVLDKGSCSNINNNSDYNKFIVK